MNICLVLLVLLTNQAHTQNFVRPTLLDFFYQQYRQVRTILTDGIGNTSEDPKNLAKARALNLLQEQVPLSVKFPCNVTGFRSLVPPSNVNEVRPGDIDIIAAIGDSLTTGSGLVATNPLQLVTENRGLAWNIGGQGTWREFLTLPNILKEFNPNLFGYSLADSMSHEPKSQFNVAEIATFSNELPFMTKVLIERIKADPRVDLKNHWKLITLMIGVNNFCLDICYQPNPEDILITHRKDLLQVFRLLKKNLPRTILNLVPPLNVSLTKNFRDIPQHCQFLNIFECHCIFQTKNANQVKKYSEIMTKWQELEEEIANMDEFHTNDFAVNYQPFPRNIKIPRLADNTLDLTYFSRDCHHISQKLNAEVANALWNNMLEAPGNKTTTNFRLFERFRCPSEEKPYVCTKMNTIF